LEEHRAIIDVYHVCLKISDILLHLETRAAQRRLVSKIEAKFRTFHPYEDGRTRCLGKNEALLMTKRLVICFDGRPLRGHREPSSGNKKYGSVY